MKNKNSMKVFLALLILLLSINFIQCLQMCKLDLKNCKTTTKECSKLKCNGIYKYPCGGFCSLNKLECDHLYYIRLVQNLYLGLKMKLSQQGTFKNEIASIKNCHLSTDYSKNKIKFDSSTDYCMKNKSCKIKNCSVCQGKLNFDCGINYCAKDRKKCNDIMKKNVKLNYCNSAFKF